MDHDHRRTVVEAMVASRWHMDTLRAARDLGLPDWAIGAGFVRNAVWDRLHGFARPTPLVDIDVLFFDAGDASPAREKTLEAALADALPDRPWEVRNQARMHSRNSNRAYRSTEDAMTFWLETPTCVAVRLDADDTLAVIAPFGLADLIAMRGVPTAAGRQRIDQYRARMRAKDWSATWPRVRVAGLD